MKANEIVTVFKGDLMNLVRDYRTLLIMIGMPVLIYPLLMVVPVLTSQYLHRDLGEEKHRVVLSGDFKLAEPFLARSKNIELYDPKGADPLTLMEDGKIILMVEFPEDFSKRLSADVLDNPTIQLVYDARKDKTMLAMFETKTALNDFRKSVIDSRSRALDFHPPEQYAVSFDEVAIEPIRTIPGLPSKTLSSPLMSHELRMVIPFFLFAMIIISVMYPALDVITGERERNSLALLLIAPVEKHSIMIGKLLVVVACGFFTIALGLVSLFCVLSYLAHAQTEIDCTFSPFGLFLCIVISAPLIISLSSLSVLLASLCKTFQQGQGYFTPFLFLIMGAAGTCMMPGLKLSTGMAFVPVVNTALSIKEVLSGSIDWPWIAVTYVATLIFAGIVTLLAARTLDKEDLLFGTDKPRLYRWKEGDFAREIVVFVAVVFILMFYVGQTLQTWDMIIGTIITQVVVILVPAFLFLRYLKRPPIKESWSLKIPTATMFVLALLATPPMIALSASIFYLQGFVVPAPEIFKTIFEKLIAGSDKPFFLVVLALAITPAICEEAMFRGTLLFLVRKRFGVLASCLIIGAVFGLFHTSIFRFLPTCALGIFLTWITIASGSIYPAVLIHALNNTFGVIVTRYKLEDSLAQYWPAAVASAALFLLVFELSRRKQEKDKSNV